MQSLMDLLSVYKLKWYIVWLFIGYAIFYSLRINNESKKNILLRCICIWECVIIWEIFPKGLLTVIKVSRLSKLT